MKRGSSQLTLDQLKAGAPALKIPKVREIPLTYIYVDGYYGNHVLMKEETMARARAAILHQVLKVWNIPPEGIVWVMVLGAWSKSVPLYIMSVEDVGIGLQVHVPCKSEIKGSSRIGLSGSKHATLLKNSLDKMKQRLDERKGARDTMHLVTMLQELKDNSKKHKAGIALHDHDGFKEAEYAAKQAANYFIQLPLTDPAFPTTGNSYGDRTYETFAHTRRHRIDLYKLMKR